MAKEDIDALMARAFNLPAPPRPAWPREGEKPAVEFLPDEAMDMLAAAGEPLARQQELLSQTLWGEKKNERRK